MKLKYWFLGISLILMVLNSWGQDKMTTQEYIEKYKYIAIKEMIDYQIPASITLAQGILESGSGNSRLAVEANNHFGIKCHSDWQGPKIFEDDDKKNECFRVYPSAEQSFRDHSLFLKNKKRYADLFTYEIEDYRSWAKGLKKAGYATNSKYPKLLIDLIERYSLYQYDTYDKNKFSKLLTDNHLMWSDSVYQMEVDSSFVAGVDSLPEPSNMALKSPSREILYYNRIKYIVFKKGDAIDRLAKELDMFEWEFYRYNELDKNRIIEPGTRLYLQPKRRRGGAKSHVLKKGESLWDVSQFYGIKLSWLMKRNGLRSDDKVKAGTTLILRGRKKN